jgi:hypothetical protein
LLDMLAVADCTFGPFREARITAATRLVSDIVPVNGSVNDARRDESPEGIGRMPGVDGRGNLPAGGHRELPGETAKKIT